MAESFYDLVKRSRTVRRYEQNSKIPNWILVNLVDMARLTPSAGNRQPTRFMIVNKPKINKELFKHLGWLGYIAEDLGPAEGERPSAYIVLLYDTTINKGAFQYDAGIVSQTIVLGANSYDLSCCIIGAVNTTKVRELLNIPEYLGITSVIAIGYPKEEVVLEQAKDKTDIKYWRDNNKIHHVPKLSLGDVLIYIPSTYKET